MLAASPGREGIDIVHRHRATAATGGRSAVLRYGERAGVASQAGAGTAPSCTIRPMESAFVQRSTTCSPRNRMIVMPSST